MSDDCTCARCQGDGHYGGAFCDNWTPPAHFDHRFEELRERLKTSIPPLSLLDRYKSYSEDLEHLIGCDRRVPELKEKHGL